MVSWIFVLAVAVFFVLLGIKMVPTYLEYYSIKRILLRMEEDKSLHRKGVTEIRKVFKRSLRINSVYDFDMKDLKVTRVKDRHEIQTKYEIRKPVAGNVSVVMAFDEKISIPAR